MSDYQTDGVEAGGATGMSALVTVTEGSYTGREVRQFNALRAALPAHCLSSDYHCPVHPSSSDLGLEGWCIDFCPPYSAAIGVEWNWSGLKSWSSPSSRGLAATPRSTRGSLSPEVQENLSFAFEGRLPRVAQRVSKSVNSHSRNRA